MQPIRFHKHHGQNIVVSGDGTVATRTCSFAHGICFGDRPLNPDEIFLVQILQNETGWSGHLRIGLTQHDPGTAFTLPQYALPDFVTMLGKSWVMAVTKTQKYVFKDQDASDAEPLVDNSNTSHQSILGSGEWIRTRHGTVRRTQLLPKVDLEAGVQDLDILDNANNGEDQPSGTSELLPTQVGSRLGLVFTKHGKLGDLYVIVNGEEHGPVAKDIPASDGPLWPVVDVYGTTKQVQIVHLAISESLQTLCRDRILQFLPSTKDIDALPLPKKLKLFLKYDT